MLINSNKVIPGTKKDNIIKFRVTKEFKDFVKSQYKIKGFSSLSDYLTYLIYEDINK